MCWVYGRSKNSAAVIEQVYGMYQGKGYDLAIIGIILFLDTVIVAYFHGVYFLGRGLF